MAKATRKKSRLGAKTKKSARKRPLGKSLAAKKKNATKKQVARPRSKAVISGPELADPKFKAVVGCVNALMDAARPDWNDNGRMDTDYHYNTQSMRAFLSSVRACLLTKNCNFDFNDDAFIQSCVAAAVYHLKILINGRTT